MNFGVKRGVTTVELIEVITSKENLNRAYKKVVANKGTSKRYLTEHYHKELELLNLTLPIIENIPAISFHEAKVKVAEHYNRTVKDWEDFETEEEKLLSELIYKERGSEFVFVTH